MTDSTQQARAASIPDAAIEAAARAMTPAVWGPSVWQFAAHGETPTAARDRVQQESLQAARRALEAAAPFIVAQALEQTAAAIASDEDPRDALTIGWLLKRAETTRG